MWHHLKKININNFTDYTVFTRKQNRNKQLIIIVSKHKDWVIFMSRLNLPQNQNHIDMTEMMQYTLSSININHSGYKTNKFKRRYNEQL